MQILEASFHQHLKVDQLPPGVGAAMLISTYVVHGDWTYYITCANHTTATQHNRQPTRNMIAFPFLSRCMKQKKYKAVYESTYVVAARWHIARSGVPYTRIVLSLALQLSDILICLLIGAVPWLERLAAQMHWSSRTCRCLMMSPCWSFLLRMRLTSNITGKF